MEKVFNTTAACIRKEKFSLSEIEDAIQGNLDKGSIGLMNSLANLYVDNKLTLDMCKAQIEEKNYEVFSRIIAQVKKKKAGGSIADNSDIELD